MKLCDFYEGKMRELPVTGDPFVKTYDVIVAGMGVAGVAAALSAARLGLSVLGVEQLSVMGGTGTSGGIWMYYKGNPGGTYRDIDTLGDQLYQADVAADGESKFHRYGGISILYKTEAARMLCEEAGVETLFDTVVTGVYREDNRVVGVRVFDGENRSYGAGCVIDCTADGCVCQAAGCAFYPGRASDHSFQPYSNIMISYWNGSMHFANTDSGLLNQYDPFAYGHAALYSATAPLFLQEKYSPDRRFLALAPLLGLREGRTIVGEETVTLSDVLDSVDQPAKESTAFYAMSHVDDHSADYAYGDVAYCELMSVTGLWNQDFTFAIPMGALIPQGFDGILAAGRMVSVDHDMAQAMRMMIDMHKSGEAAAALAALALDQGCAAKDVAPADLREALSKTGCYRDTDRAKMENTPDGNYYKDTTSFEEAFRGDMPGQWLMSARYMPADFGDTLAQWCTSDDLRLRNNSALALAMRRDSRGVPVLLDMLKDKSGYTPKGYYVPDQTLAAVTACGLMGVAEAVPQLFAMMEPGYTDGIPFVPGGYTQTTPLDLRFQYFTYAHMALLRIVQANPALGKDVLDRLGKILYAPGFDLDKPDTLPCNSRTGIILRVHERFLAGRRV